MLVDIDVMSHIIPYLQYDNLCYLEGWKPRNIFF